VCYAGPMPVAHVTVPDQSGKTYLITGANTGIGKVTARALAAAGARVVIAGRSRDKTGAVIEEIMRDTGNRAVEYVALDLGDLASVRACGEAIAARPAPIDGLINNAGMAGQRGLTADGFELAFGTNHLGPYLLTRLVLPRLIAAGRARIVHVASQAHHRARGVDWDAVKKPTRTITGMHEYGISKLCNILCSNELARRLAATGVTSYALHPGVVRTDVWRRVPGPLRWLITRAMLSPEDGAAASLRCATAPELASESGRYYDVGGVEATPSAVARDAALAGELWARSAAWTGVPVELATP
jgi:NAD(P)-dependent dehydrogenase (short-subunit alcohol dehydrogenase family)